MKRRLGRDSRKHVIRAGFVATAAAGLMTLLVGCNTTEGVGKDIKSAGKGIEEAAQDAKK